jgi:hypothetical protein
LPPYSKAWSAKTAGQVRTILGPAPTIRTNNTGGVYIYPVWYGIFGKLYISFDTNGVIGQVERFYLMPSNISPEPTPN